MAIKLGEMTIEEKRAIEKRKAIEKRVKAVVIKRFDLRSLKEEDITSDSDFSTEFGADSLDLVELKLALETEFHLNIPEEEEDIRTINDAVGRIIKEIENQT